MRAGGMRYSRDFTITRQDTQQFYSMLVLRRWCKGILGFAAVGALVAKLYINWLGFALDTVGTAVVMLLTGILTALLITVGMIIRTRGNVSKMMRKRGRESYVQQTRIDGFGVHVTVDKDSAKLNFGEIKKVEETAAAFYIFLTDADAWILPKNQMEDSEAECRAIREIFSRVIAPKRLKLQK